MPQGRRRKPFSHKAKKEQMKNKRHQNVLGSLQNSADNPYEGTSKNVLRINDYHSSKGSKSKPNRYALHFYRETDAEIRERKEIACRTLEIGKEEDLEVNSDSYYVPELDFPKRPPWSSGDSVERLNMKENEYFTKYIGNIEKTFEWKDLGYFELNLETWRQLWRVLEMSDVILFIVDIRFAGLMFPPSLYDYVSKTLNKDFILVLNKIDLAPTELVVAWKVYFQEKYPKLHILLFTTLPSYNLIGSQSNSAGLQVRRRRTKFQIAAEGTQLLIDVCKEIVGDDVDLTSWQDKVKSEMEDCAPDEKVDVEELIHVVKPETEYYEHEKYINGVLTIGCIGQPNVGKSSLINAIMDNDEEWSAMNICEAWAKKRGFVTARAARLDCYRAANGLLRFALDGKICLCLRPPDFCKNKEFWFKHEENRMVKWIQGNLLKEDPSEFDEISFDEDEVDGTLSASDAESDECRSDEEVEESNGAIASNKFAALVDD
ncbi:hypothetical protein FQA39_LY03996 [Lamprigera yunnana]|nr:hypothetical protein FQA39_LY03996 [Lamprigera yunnana]